jgi:hypothetical protein
MLRRAVIDSNLICSDELRLHLSVDDNVAVLSDYVWVECYKQASVQAVSELISVIRDYPLQVVVLQSGDFLANVDPRQPGYLETFARTNVAADLLAMAAAVDRAELGEEGVLAQLREQWAGANQIMEGMLEGAAEIAPSLTELAAMFSQEELRRCRTKASYTPDMTWKVFATAYQLYEIFTKEFGRLPILPPRYAVQTYYYRLALGMMLHCIWWIQNGNQPVQRLDRLRNDIIDMGLAVCATYYDDLLTADAKAKWMYRELSNAVQFAEYMAMQK